MLQIRYSTPDEMFESKYHFYLPLTKFNSITILELIVRMVECRSFFIGCFVTSTLYSVLAKYSGISQANFKRQFGKNNVGVIFYKAVESRKSIVEILTLTSDLVWPCMPRPLDLQHALLFL